MTNFVVRTLYNIIIRYFEGTLPQRCYPPPQFVSSMENLEFNYFRNLETFAREK